MVGRGRGDRTGGRGSHACSNPKGSSVLFCYDQQIVLLIIYGQWWPLVTK